MNARVSATNISSSPPGTETARTRGGPEDELTHACGVSRGIQTKPPTGDSWTSVASHPVFVTPSFVWMNEEKPTQCGIGGESPRTG